MRFTIAIIALGLASVPGISAPASPPAVTDVSPSYPSKPIRLLVPFTPGSATDVVARMLGPKLVESWGQPVVVDNRPSAGGTVAGAIVAAAPADGHTLLLASSVFAGSAALYPNLPYDTLKDFAGVTQVGSTPMVIATAPSLGMKTLRDLIALAQQKPGQVNFGSSGIGSGTHVGGEFFKLAARIDIVHVPYKGTPEAINDAIAGRIQFVVSSVVPAIPLVKSGRLQALAVTTRDRLAALPEVPTVAEAALPGFHYDGWYGLIAPAKTPRSVVNKLSQEVGRILRQPDLAERLASQGAAARPTTPEEFDQMVRNEITLRGKVLKATGAKPE
jgi:tripartite-type tricarboxylate transporter receptor subunit TctC